jgi:hypothetical protein
LSHILRACDEAFTIKENSEDGLIYLSVMPMDESDESNLALAIGIPLALAVLLLVAVFVWYEQNRKQNDMIWKVKREELRFADPPKVIGRGTFGLVLLAGTYLLKDIGAVLTIYNNALTVFP